MNKRKRRERGTKVRVPTRSSPRKANTHCEDSQDTQSESEELESTPQKTSPKSVSKRPKPSETVKSVGEKGYTSDGTSFELLADDDTLPDINISSPYRGRKYVKDDIVWAPYKHMYWPALVTSVKWPSVCFLYINEDSKPVYRTHARRLISFDNPAKNLELKEQGNKAYIEFEGAYELVVKYFCMRKQNSNINARRFLTQNTANDKIRQAKDCLFRLTGESDANSEEDSDRKDKDTDDDVEIIDVYADDDVEDDDEVEDDVEDEEGLNHPLCTQSADEKAKVKEILRDLETLPRYMTVSSKKSEELEEEAKQLLRYIESKDCFDHLRQIRKGSIQSSRHTKFMNNQLVLGGLGPFTLFEDLTARLLTALDNHCDEYDVPSEYKINVMLPEAVIYAITKMKACDKLTAKQYFNQMCKKVGIRD